MKTVGGGCSIYCWNHRGSFLETNTPSEIHKLEARWIRPRTGTRDVSNLAVTGNKTEMICGWSGWPSRAIGLLIIGLSCTSAEAAAAEDPENWEEVALEVKYFTSCWKHGIFGVQYSFLCLPSLVHFQTRQEASSSLVKSWICTFKQLSNQKPN